MKPDDRDPIVDRLMEGLAPPQPPPELRSRALTAARERLAGEAVPDVWSRIWNHRGVRLAWAASLVLLLAGHVLATLSPVGPISGVDPVLMAQNGVDEHMAGLLRPIRISENVRPLVGLVAGTDVPIEIVLEGNSP
jgi:hypothetical protein